MSPTTPRLVHAPPHAKPPALETRGETLLSLAVASGVVVGLLALSSMVVLWDMGALRERIASYFQVELREPPPPIPARAAADQAEALAQDLRADAHRPLFSDRPGAALESPTPYALRQGTTRLEPPGVDRAVSRAAPPTELPTPVLHARHAVQPLKPVLPAPTARLPAAADEMPRFTPNLDSLYADDHGSPGKLGRPGEQAWTPKPLTQPAAPTAPALLAPKAVAAPAPFKPTADAGDLTRRLVRERPAPGYPELDDDIDARFEVYQPRGDGQAYFRLTLSLANASALPTIPKNVLVLLDISGSIDAGELRGAETATLGYLGGLRGRDAWQVVLFADAPWPYGETYAFQPAGGVDASELRRFIGFRKDQRQTDVFGVTRLILGRVPAGERPTNIFLVTDGKATSGIGDVRALVADFRRVNRENFAIFAFNGGRGGNRFLLELLAHRSRGAYREEPNFAAIPAALGGMMQRYDAPVLTHVVASHTNLSAAEVHPQVLPNLYRGAPIQIWGRCAPGRDVILRLAGLDGRGAAREFFFQAPMPTDRARHPEIAREWAERKAWYLIARLAENPGDGAARAELARLIQGHGLAWLGAMLSRGGFWGR